MANGLLEGYRLYKLVIDSEPYIPYKKGSGYYHRNSILGECRLELVWETMTKDELLNCWFPKKVYYETGKARADAFELEGGYKFDSLSVSSANDSVFYHTKGIAIIEGQYAFEVIYSTYDDEIFFVISAWNAEQIEDMQISFEKPQKQEYFLFCNLKFAE